MKLFILCSSLFMVSCGACEVQRLKVCDWVTDEETGEVRKFCWTAESSTCTPAP